MYIKDSRKPSEIRKIGQIQNSAPFALPPPTNHAHRKRKERRGEEREEWGRRGVGGGEREEWEERTGWERIEEENKGEERT